MGITGIGHTHRGHALRREVPAGGTPEATDGGSARTHGHHGHCHRACRGGADAAATAVNELSDGAMGAAAAPDAVTATTAIAGGGTSQAATATSLLSRAASAVPNSSIASQVFAAVEAGGAQVNVVDDAQFAASYGRASGVFDPDTNAITVPQSVAADPAQAGLILLHEGVHWLQQNASGGIDAMGGAIAQALQGANAGSTATSAKGIQQQDEAQAYLLEAVAAKQAGTPDDGMGTTSSGKVGTYAQILGAVRSTPEYA